MEKSWEDFWTTGKVEDYLTYRNSMGEKEDKNTQQQGLREGTKETGQTWKGF